MTEARNVTAAGKVPGHAGIVGRNRHHRKKRYGSSHSSGTSR
jgi:hypothetical protein